MSEDRIINDLIKRVKHIDKTVNKVVPFISLLIFIVAVADQLIRETSYHFREPQQLCLLPLIIVPNLVMCIGVLRENKLNKYMLFALIWHVISWALIVVGEDYIMPTYLYGTHNAEIFLAAFFLGSITNVVSFIIKWKPFMKVSLIFNIVVYIAVIIYIAITQPFLSQFANECVYYALGFISFFLSILFNLSNIDSKEKVHLLNEDIDEFPELYQTDDTLVDPIQVIFEVYMLRNLRNQHVDSGIDYNIFYHAVTQGEYLDVLRDNHLYGKDFMDKMIEDFLSFKSMCVENLEGTSEKLQDFFEALQLIQQCEDEEKKDRLIYELLLMVRSDRRFFTKE